MHLTKGRGKAEEQRQMNPANCCYAATGDLNKGIEGAGVWKAPTAAVVPRPGMRGKWADFPCTGSPVLI